MKILYSIFAVILVGCSNDLPDTLNNELNILESERVIGQKKVYEHALKARGTLNSGGNRQALSASTALLKDANTIIWDVALTSARIEGTLYALDEKCGYRKERRVEAHSKAQDQVIDLGSLTEGQIMQIENAFWAQENKVRTMLSTYELGFFCVKFAVSEWVSSFNFESG